MDFIRKATIDDIPAIRDLAVIAFPATYKEILTAEQISYMMEMMYSESSLRSQMTHDIFFICDGRGYASYRYEGLSEEGINIFHLEKLYVLPAFQGSGLGSKLFDTVVNAAKESCKGAIRIELNVNRYNKALSFYEHIGMRRDRQGDFPIGEGFYMNDYIMAIDFPE